MIQICLYMFIHHSYKHIAIIANNDDDEEEKDIWETIKDHLIGMLSLITYKLSTLNMCCVL